MSKYLYGASVQGIQNFIFQTNKLQEIVGASELVEDICTDFFKNSVRGCGDYKEDNLILGAAGNIKYIFDDRESCEKFVRLFPKAVMEKAPGITISQAVVEVTKGRDNIQLLEERLRTQRNKSISITEGVGLMITETARRTGGVGVKYDRDEVLDQAQTLKRGAFEKASKKLLKKLVGQEEKLMDKFPFDLKHLAKDSEKSWIAVIHADGNNLGQKIISMVKNVGKDKSLELIRELSIILGEVTEMAAKIAFSKEISQKGKDEKFRYPFRPVILGGDDLTAIVRADLALGYTERFLSEFERLSIEQFKEFGEKNNLKMNPFEKGLTACAGIS